MNVMLTLQINCLRHTNPDLSGLIEREDIVALRRRSHLEVTDDDIAGLPDTETASNHTTKLVKQSRVIRIKDI
jgi:hypothetical protein